MGTGYVRAAHEAQVLSPEIELRHEPDGLRHEGEDASVLLCDGEDVRGHREACIAERHATAVSPRLSLN